MASLNRIEIKINPKLKLKLKLKLKSRPGPQKPNIVKTSKESVFGIPLFDTDIITSNPKEAGEILYKYGCVVIPCYEDSELRTIRQQTIDDVKNYPEYRGDGITAAKATLETCEDSLNYSIIVHKTKSSPQSVFEGTAGSKKQLISLAKGISRFSGKRIKPILGAFQAHGNPSSFHCTSSRHVRLKCYEAGHQLFAYVEPGPGPWYVEMNYDRAALRQAGSKITEDKDKWHRDLIKGEYLEDGDSIFGGWINLDNTNNQRFICDLGTHQRPEASGFHRDTPNEQANSITIPPGHMVIFYQHILHAVAPTKFISDSYRQFISFRLTRSTTPLWGGTVKMDTIHQQLVPKTPSNQQIKVWMSNHHTSGLLWSHTIVWGLVTFKQEYITKKTTKQGATYFLPESPMVPKYPLSMYPAYTQKEIDIMIPQLLVRF